MRGEYGCDVQPRKRWKGVVAVVAARELLGVARCKNEVEAQERESKACF